MASRPCRAKASVHAASTAASTTGRCSGRQPAITALTATFSTVHVDEVGRDDGDDLGGVARRAREHAQHPLLGRRDDRQSVGPAAVVHRLELVLEVGQLDPARGEPASAQAPLERLLDLRLDRARPAARPVLGQPGTQPGDPGQRLPALAQPALGALDLGAVLDAQEGRHRLHLQAPAALELAVVDDGQPRREARVVLADDGERPGGGELRQHRHDELARRALPLDHRDPAVRELHPPTVAPCCAGGRRAAATGPAGAAGSCAPAPRPRSTPRARSSSCTRPTRRPSTSRCSPAARTSASTTSPASSTTSAAWCG